MNMQEIIDRINELYHKSQNEGLTEEEKAEQKDLRQQYVLSIRRSLRGQLDNIDIQNEDGSITISQNGKNLALADSYSSMNLGEVNDKWVLEDAGNGLFYVKNVVRGNYIEWYNDMNNWSSYNKIGSGKEDLFALQFVALNVQQPGENPGETPSEPSEPNQPTGDMSIAGLVIALTAATGAAIVLTKKKEF